MKGVLLNVKISSKKLLLFVNSLNEVRRNVKVGTSVECKGMISMNHHSHSQTGTLQHMPKPTQSRRELERNNREEMVKK